MDLTKRTSPIGITESDSDIWCVNTAPNGLVSFDPTAGSSAYEDAGTGVSPMEDTRMSDGR